MSFCKSALLWSIVMVVCKSSDFCVSGDFEFAGEYTDTGETFNDVPYYEITEVGDGCDYSTMYILNQQMDDKWYITGGGSSWSAVCSTSTTSPADCSDWTGFFSGDATVTTGSCPVFGCDAIRVTNAGVWVCNGVFTKTDTNYYVDADGVYSWSFSNKNDRWYCSTGDQRTACSFSYYAKQKTAGWFDMNDGDSRSVEIYYSNNYYTATFECVATTVCFCNSGTFGDSSQNGEYELQSDQYNGQLTYYMSNSYGSWYIFWSSTANRWRIYTEISENGYKLQGTSGETDLDIAFDIDDLEMYLTFNECYFTFWWGTLPLCDVLPDGDAQQINMIGHNDNIKVPTTNYDSFLHLLKSSIGATIMFSLFISGCAWTLILCYWECKRTNTASSQFEGYSKGKIIDVVDE